MEPSALYIYLSKILPLLVLPIGIVIELSLVALVLLVKDRRKTAAVFLAAAILVLWVASMPMVAAGLMGKLERDFPAVAVQDIPAGQCIVLLGGVVGPAMAPRVDIDMLEAVDRVRKAAQLFHADKAAVIIVAGGNHPWSPFAEPEAESIKTLLLEWGVPAAAIVLEGTSRNTRENALNSIVLLEKLACGTPLLVTSAAHMQRSVAVFEKLGVTVLPVSADVRVIKKPNLTPLDFLPDAEALKMTTDALREWMGQRVYRVRGWN